MDETCISQSAQLAETFSSMMENKENFRSKKINIFEAPEFTQRLKTFLEIETGKSATFVGYFRATPPPTVMWVREDQELNNTDKHIIVTDQTTGCSVLTITHVNRKDEGPYKCKLENQEGVASSTGYLSIIASKSRRSKKKGGSASRVSSPPVLKSILEQSLVEEKEEEEFVKMPPSPLNEFIAAIKHSARSMNSAINYGNLENVPEEMILEAIDDEVFNSHQRNGKVSKIRRNNKVCLTDDEMSAGESSSSESEYSSKQPHYSSLSQLLCLDSVSQASTGEGDLMVNGQRVSHKTHYLGRSPEGVSNKIKITTASRKETSPQPPQKLEFLPPTKRPPISLDDKLDLYIKNNNLSDLISPKITASRPQQPEIVTGHQQKQLQKLHQIQDFKLLKQQLRQQHKDLQEQIKKKQKNKILEQKLRKTLGICSEHRPLKLNSSSSVNNVSSQKTVLQDSNNVTKENPPKFNTERRGSLIEIKDVSKELKDSFTHPTKSVSVKSSLVIPTSGVKNDNPNTDNNPKSSILEEFTSVWISNPCSYFQISFVIAMSLAALATDSHPITVVVIVALASLIAFSQIPQLWYSYFQKYLPGNHNNDDDD